MTRLVTVVLAGLLLLSTTPSWAQTKADACTSPRKALDTWLSNFQSDNTKPDIAQTCFDWATAGTPPKERADLALKLKKVLDARGLWVEMDEIPDDPNVEKERVVPFPHTFEAFYLIKKRDQWLISSETIAVTPENYEETFAFNAENVVNQMPESLAFLRGTIAGVAYWQLLGFILGIVVSLIIRSLVTGLVTSQGVKVLERFRFKATSELVRKAAKPIGTLVMAGLLFYIVPALHFSVGVNQVLIIALRVLAALATVMVLYRIVDVVADVFERRAALTETKLDDQLVPLIRKSVKVFVAAIGFIFVLQNMNVDVASLLAGASLGGLAFTLAAKDTVANLFGSLSIFADRPFQIGDWIVVGGSTEGVVEEVGMRTTRVRTFYDSIITVPNARVADSVVDNYGERTYRRCFTTLGVTYDTTPEQIQAFCEGIRAILKANKYVRKDMYEVVMSGFGAHSLDIMVYFFFKVETWSEELLQRHNVFLEIMRLARHLKVEFAFPTQTLHVASQADRHKPVPHVAPDNDVLTAGILAFAPDGKLSRPNGPKLTDGFFAEPASGGDEDGTGEG